MKVLSDDPTGEMERLLHDIVKWQRENPPETKYDGFEYWQVHSDWRALNKLMRQKILEVRLKTNKSTVYRALDLEAIQKALNDYQGLATPLSQEAAEIPPDLFKIVVGHDEKKDILWRSIRSEKPIHCLLYGSVASAKTLILEELARLPRNRLILGSSLSKAGLYEVMFNENPKYLVIDEIDKIDDESNLSALLSLMESGFLSETKYRRHGKRYFTTWVYASANRITRIPQELISRFCKLRFKDYSPNEFLQVTLRVLTERENIPPSLAAYVAEKCLKELASRDVRDAVRVARLLKTHDRKEVDHVIRILKKQK